MNGAHILIEGGGGGGGAGGGGAMADSGLSKEAAAFAGGLPAKDYITGRMPTAFQERWAAGERTPQSAITNDIQRADLAKYLEGKQVSVRVPAAAISKIMVKGKIDNAFESQTTNAGGGFRGAQLTYYMQKRQEGELRSFGIAKNAAPDARPVYGSMSHGSNPDMYGPGGVTDHATIMHAAFNDYNYGGKSHVTDFGKVSADPRGYVMIPGMGEPIDRAKAARILKSPYYTLGDVHFIADAHGKINDNVLAAEANLKHAVRNYGDTQIVLKPSILKMTSVTNGDSLDSTLVGIPHKLAISADPRTPIEAAGNGDVKEYSATHYVEGQVFGGVNTSDIQAVHFMGKAPSGVAKTALSKAGISYSVQKPLAYSDLTPATKEEIAAWLGEAK